MGLSELLRHQHAVGGAVLIDHLRIEPDPLASTAERDCITSSSKVILPRSNLPDGLSCTPYKSQHIGNGIAVSG